MKKICYKIAFLVVFLLGVAFCGVVFSDDTFAGGWISGDAGESSYDGGPGGEWHDCSNIGGSYLLECTGFSWVFYKSTGNIESSIYFRPDLSSNKIDKVCSEHTDQNGGFWHFGRNARGISGGGYNKQERWQTFNYFGDFDYVNNYYDTNARVTYSTGAGNWGHMETLNYRLYGSYGSSYYKTPTSLKHTIYVDGEAIYNAQKYGTISQVLSDYKKAYKYVTGSDYTGNSLPGDMYAFCYWDDMAGSTFEGDSGVMEVSENNPNIGWQSVPEGKRRFVGWKSTNAAASTYVVNNCDSVDGCLVSFRHYLKRTSGSGSTKYSVTRDSGNNISETTWNFTKTNEGENVTTNPVRMYPGQKVCETLNFYTKSSSDGSTSDRASTTVCAAAVATVGADIDIQIRDQQSSSSYDEYGKNDNIYTKPNDTVDLKGAYNPAYRAMYNISLQAPSKTNGFANNGKTIGETFNANVDPDWDNVFSINLDNNTNANHCSGDYKYYIRGTSKFPAGRPASYDGEVGYAVGDKDVGKTVKAQATTNVCEYGKNTPKQVSLTYSDSAAFTATVDTTDKRSKEVSFMVPYNFSNSTRITTSEDKVVYAGESTTIDYVINVGVKENSETNGTYATRVPDASWGLRVSYDGGVNWSENIPLGEGDLNSGNEYKFEGGEEEKGGTEGTIINVPDISAGAKVCFQSWVYPADSGGPRNLNPSEFSGTAYSAPVCLTVAKKPSFQVWGGNIYSAGDVKTLTSNKIHVAGRTTYAPIVESPVYHVFGSWTELELVANTKAEGLASGAGTGFNVNPDGIGGSEESTLNYCLRSTLSFANSNCNGSLGFGNSVEKNLEYSNKTELISRFASLEEGNYEIQEHEENRVEIGEGVTVAKGNTKIITARNGTVVITGDIRYGDDKYNTLAEIPKLIIYARDIKIKCDVGQIDAVLIAEGNVNTCVDGNDETPLNENSQARSAKQLVIRGSVVANTLSLNRTYGAATGDNSIQSAEIINYDSSLYLWANSWADVSTSGDLTEAAIYEVAPRY